MLKSRFRLAIATGFTALFIPAIAWGQSLDSQTPAELEFQSAKDSTDRLVVATSEFTNVTNNPAVSQKLAQAEPATPTTTPVATPAETPTGNGTFPELMHQFASNESFKCYSVNSTPLGNDLFQANC
jgi:transcriptional regulator with PAS, ATPase and Fis domain